MPKPDPPPGMMVEKFRGEVPAWNSDQPDPPYEAFFDPINPRENLDFQQDLTASSDKRFREFYRHLHMPSNRRVGCAAIARRLNISLAEFADFLRNASRTRSLSIAAARLPEITTHMANDALTQKEACGRCDGWGFVNVSEEEMPTLEEGKPIPGGIRPMGARWVRDCPKCDGKGKTNKAGDSHARDKILLMNGIGAKNGPAVSVAINNYGGHGIESASNRLSQIQFDVNADVIGEGGDPEIEAQRDHAIIEGDPVEGDEE